MTRFSVTPNGVWRIAVRVSSVGLVGLGNNKKGS
jgi:hypothetical protein